MYKREDFEIKVLDSRRYGDQMLLYANVRNKVTNVSIQDWIRPDQKADPTKLPINWDK